MAKQEEQRQNVRSLGALPPFQSQAQLTALKVHAVVERVYAVILFPINWVAEQFGATHVFRERAPLKAVK